MGTRYIDPIAHAWRHCNPNAPLPSALVRRAESSGSALRLPLFIVQLVAAWSGTKDTQRALPTVANLPRISPPTGE